MLFFLLETNRNVLHKYIGAIGNKLFSLNRINLDDVVADEDTAHGQPNVLAHVAVDGSTVVHAKSTSSKSRIVSR